MPNRRLVWIVRLVFYPLAIGLIALALHERAANAEGDGGRRVVTTPAPPSRATWLTGSIGAGEPATARVDGAVPTLTFPLHFRCTPDLGDVWATYPAVPAGTHRVSTSWPAGWVGLAALTIDVHHDDRTLTGTVSARMRLHADGVVADCRVDRAPLTLARADGRAGHTTQDDTVRADVHDGRVTTFSAGLRVTCDDGRRRHLVWAPAIAAGEGSPVRRTWLPVGQEDDLLLRPEAATATIDSGFGDTTLTYAVDEDGAVRGTLTTSVRLPGARGATCVTPAGGVTFTVPGG
jgi:hypothetical protein